MPLCSQPFFFKTFFKSPVFFWGGITHAQTVWVLRKPSGFQETSLCLSSGLLLDPPSGLCDVRLWPSREVQWSRNRAAEEHDATQIDDLSSSPKKAWKQTNHWLVCGKKHQKSLGFNLFLCVRKVDYITTSFKNQHGTSHGDLIWIVSLFFESSRKSLVGSHQPSERSRNPLWVAIQIHTFQMPISHSCLGLKNKLQFAVFFWFWDVFCRFRFLFFFGQMVNKKILLKRSKKGFWSREALFSGPGFCLSFEVLPDPGGQQAREHAFGRQWTAPRRKNGWVLKKPRSTRGGRVPQNVGSGWVYPVWRIQNVGQKLVVFFKYFFFGWGKVGFKFQTHTSFFVDYRCQDLVILNMDGGHFILRTSSGYLMLGRRSRIFQNPIADGKIHPGFYGKKSQEKFSNPFVLFPLYLSMYRLLCRVSGVFPVFQDHRKNKPIDSNHPNPLDETSTRWGFVTRLFDRPRTSNLTLAPTCCALARPDIRR